MIECRRAPPRRGVALCAIMTEVPRNMARVCYVDEIRLMTLIAIGVHQLIVPIGMTQLALHGGVRPSQRETSGTMVERRAAPVCR